MYRSVATIATAMTSRTITRRIHGFFLPGTSSSNDRPFAPEVDQCIDVIGNGNGRADLQGVLREHVTLERAHEQKRSSGGIGNAENTRGSGALEVIDDEAKPAARRAVIVGR